MKILTFILCICTHVLWGAGAQENSDLAPSPVFRIKINEAQIYLVGSIHDLPFGCLPSPVREEINRISTNSSSPVTTFLEVLPTGVGFYENLPNFTLAKTMPVLDQNIEALKAKLAGPDAHLVTGADSHLVGIWDSIKDDWNTFYDQTVLPCISTLVGEEGGNFFSGKNRLHPYICYDIWTSLLARKSSYSSAESLEDAIFDNITKSQGSVTPMEQLEDQFMFPKEHIADPFQFKVYLEMLKGKKVEISAAQELIKLARSEVPVPQDEDGPSLERYNQAYSSKLEDPLNVAGLDDSVEQHVLSRNNNWLEKFLFPAIDQKKNMTILIAPGLRHLIGKNGLLRSISEHYKVDSVEQFFYPTSFNPTGGIYKSHSLS